MRMIKFISYSSLSVENTRIGFLGMSLQVELVKDKMCAEEKIVDRLTTIARQLAIKKLLKLKLQNCYYDPSSPFVRISIELTENEIEQAMLRELSWIASKKGYQVYYKHRLDAEDDQSFYEDDADWVDRSPNAQNLFDTMYMKYRPIKLSEYNEEIESASDCQ